MSRALHHSWYRIAVARPDAPAQILAAEGAHLGEAVAAAEAHSKSYAIAVDLATAAPLGESLRKPQVTVVGEDIDGTPAFRWPSGVLPQLGHAAPLAGARRGYFEHADPKLLILEAMTDAEHVVDLFLGIVERLPSADNLEVRVQDHFEDADKTDVWLTSRVNAKQIIRFLDDHDVDVLHNGHVEVSVYVRAHKATLRLTEHKTVVWLAEERGLEADVKRWLGELAVPHVDGLTTVNKVSHFHYRPAKSKDRKKLGEQLYRQRLRIVASVPRDEAAAVGRDTDA
ncbi:MAG: hypothetical protein M4D80_06760 [Myxococcota bacterium]|nr:hypothetical protein [Deltaproteobacteria bacterium]MDQ3334841.1 hypothetical protein [Myxococcota bacterium]